MNFNKLNLSFFPYSILLLVLSAAISSVMMTSCGGKKHSVREIREGQSNFATHPQVGSAMTQRLFLENKKPSLSVPKNFSSETTGGTIAVEQTVYTNPDNYSENFQDQELDTEKTYGLTEVVVEARSRFTPERDGKVDVDFIVRVPKEIIDRNWMIKLDPFVIGSDSLERLAPVVIKGEGFDQKQKMDYQAFDDYVKTIIPRQLYDRVFLKRDLVEQDIRERQQLYYDIYNKDWALTKEYEQWIGKQQKVKTENVARLQGEIYEIRHAYKRQMLAQSARSLAQGQDTTGLAMAYELETLKKTQGLRKKLDEVESKELNIPNRYKEIHEANTRSKDIGNMVMSSQDTIDIASNLYMFDAIADNELKLSRLETVKKELIPFPRVEGARVDTVVQEGADYVYYYKQRVPVVPGMSSVRISMESQVVAVDDSRYTTPSRDTLSYFISSLVQLVDTTLLHKETVRNRNAVNRQTAYVSYRPNTWRFDAKFGSNNTELEKINKDYGIFLENKGYEIDSMLLQMSTSLEGEFNKNADLSMKRVEDFKNYLMKNNKNMGSRGKDFIITKYIGEDWSAFAKHVKSRSDIINKDAILDILANAVYPDKAKEEIQAFEADYKIIKDSIYPLLNKVDVLFYVHRTDMTSEQEVITVNPEYILGVRLLQNREYDEALKILANYPDYNAAVCLTALGYNGKAYEVLNKLTPNGNTEYLSAIVAWRMNQKETAVGHLLKAVELDQTKLYRMELDPDIIDLVRTSNLDTLQPKSTPAPAAEAAVEAN